MRLGSTFGGSSPLDGALREELDAYAIVQGAKPAWRGEPGSPRAAGGRAGTAVAGTKAAARVLGGAPVDTSTEGDRPKRFSP